MRKDAILSEVFFVRIKTVEALLRNSSPNSSNAAELKELGSELDGLSLRYGRASINTWHFLGMIWPVEMFLSS